jgi:hypothetical protein
MFAKNYRIDNIPELLSMLKKFSCDLDDLGKVCKKIETFIESSESQTVEEFQQLSKELDQFSSFMAFLKF